ncbi:uncharacterized protein LOC118180253 [Stegodyphus dumicola]|uniref:uncharacterized protein LOC118180253 n=1 Tax=Stegodyphus dumicola TaxID=202533 RepID=UPI0015B1DE92|nr:uncharacterized protein LOC118180253 [Stegodyphus dumicola]
MKGATLGFFCMWIMSTFVLQVSYGGTLIGFLTFPNQEPSIATLEDLASAITKRNVKIAFKIHSLAESLLVGNVKHGRLFQETINRVPESKVRTHEEGFRKVLMENFVYFANKFGCTYDSFQGEFEKLQMHDVFQANYIGIAASKDFKYLKEFNIVLRRLAERGLIAKWRSDILARRMIDVVFSGEIKVEETEIESKSHALTVNHLQGAFILLTIGHSIATLVLISEVLYRRAVNKSPSGSIRKSVTSDIVSEL